MVKIYSGKLTKTALSEMKKVERMRKKYGSTFTTNKYFVYDGSTMKAAQKYKGSAMKWFKPGMCLVGVE